MSSSVAMNDVVRVLGTELGKDGERVLIGSTEEEKEVLQKHATMGKRRAAVGFIAGSAACAGVWKALGGQRRLVGGITMASGGLTGFMYGLLSIRRGLFEDVLSLPSDKSPFAHRAREVLDEQLPNNAFYLEVKKKLKQQEGETGSWESVPASATFKEASTLTDEGRDFRGFDGSSASPSRMPRLPPLPQNDDAFNSDGANFSENDASKPSPSPFFFGGSPSSQSDSNDSYGSRPSPVTIKKKLQDDDPYYNDGDNWGDDSNKASSKPKPVTWEELRRRAAGGK